MNSECRTIPTDFEGINIRQIPYPFNAILSICSDLDETPDKDVYLEIMRFLNTTEKTSMGEGVGLEVGNTLYFNMPDDQFSYWNTDDDGRRCVRKLIQSGFVDCIHSFGDLAKTRSDAETNINELEKYDCKIKVWVDHAQAVTNIGNDIMEGYGADITHNAYHTDLLHRYGVEYIWIGRVTSVIGQNVKRSYKGILNDKLFTSLVTVIKQVVKDALGTLGHKKYSMHRGNRLIRNITLEDGSDLIEFIRANPYWGGVDGCATADGFSEVMTNRYLSRLVQSGGVSILYTHLGKIKDRTVPFNEKTVDAFKLIKEYYDSNKILVTTTRRTLDYCSFLENSEITIDESSEAINLQIKYDGDLSSLQGFSINSKYTKKHVITLNGSACYEMDKVCTDSTGASIFQIPWKKLPYPQLN